MFSCCLCVRPSAVLSSADIWKTFKCLHVCRIFTELITFHKHSKVKHLNISFFFHRFLYVFSGINICSIKELSLLLKGTHSHVKRCILHLCSVIACKCGAGKAFSLSSGDLVTSLDVLYRDLWPPWGHQGAEYYWVDFKELNNSHKERWVIDPQDVILVDVLVACDPPHAALVHNNWWHLWKSVTGEKC